MSDLEDDDHPPNTRRAYAQDLRAWESFAGEAGQPPWPASPALLEQWIDGMIETGLRVATIRRRVGTVQRMNGERGHGDCSSKRQAKKIRKAARDEQRVIRAPITPQILAKGLPLISSARDRALLLVGWSLALRRSELVSLLWDDYTTRDGRQWTILLRRSKTDQLGAGQVFTIWPLEETARALCPVRALEQWRAEATEPRIFPVHATTVGRVVKELAAAAGERVEIYSAHSLRSGAITTAVAKGCTLIETMELSRHESPAVAWGYVKLAPRRLPAMEANLRALETAAGDDVE